jgi:hypothetical protein
MSVTITEDNQRIIFDPDGFDQFFNIIRFLEGFLLRFTFYDGTTVSGEVRKAAEDSETIPIAVWNEDADEIDLNPPLRQIDLAEVREVYYY